MHAKVLLFFAVMTVFAHPETLQSHFLKALALAKSTQELERLSRSYDELRVVDSACQIQLRENEIPTACYEVRELARRTGWQHIDPKPPTLAELDRLCARAADNLRVHPLTSPAISAFCRHKITEGLKIRAYRDEETWSEN